VRLSRLLYSKLVCNCWRPKALIRALLCILPCPGHCSKHGRSKEGAGAARNVHTSL
jgi:hypothetical protein